MKIINHRRGVNAVSGAVLALALVGFLSSCESKAAEVDKSVPGWDAIYYPEAQFDFDEDRQAVVVKDSPGGYAPDFVSYYEALDKNGIPLRIEGPCISACTFFLGTMHPSLVCATDAAEFGFHGVYEGIEGYFSKKWTAEYHSKYYPEPVREALAEAGFDGSKDVDKKAHPDGLIHLSRQTLAIRRCPN